MNIAICLWCHIPRRGNLGCIYSARLARASATMSSWILKGNYINMVSFGFTRSSGLNWFILCGFVNRSIVDLVLRFIYGYSPSDYIELQDLTRHIPTALGKYLMLVSGTIPSRCWRHTDSPQ